MVSLTWHHAAVNILLDQIGARCAKLESDRAIPVYRPELEVCKRNQVENA